MSDAAPSPLRRVFADNVRKHRKAIGISQEELADRARVHRTYVGAVEPAEVNISLDNDDRISTALGAEAGELLQSD